MSQIIRAMVACIRGASSNQYDGQDKDNKANTFNTETKYTDQPSSAEDDQRAADFVQFLCNAEKGGRAIRNNLNDRVDITSWTENLAKRVLASLVTAIAAGKIAGQAAKDAVERAVVAGAEFSKEHPVYTTLIALGVLVVLAPWVLEALGFAEAGPVGGTFASWWQSTYAGYVPKNSLFGFFQRLGMAWGGGWF